MKIPPALIPLTREHQYSLILANKVINPTRPDDTTYIDSVCQEIRDTFCTKMHNHFAFEEEIILPLLEQNYPKECARIRREHQTFMELAPQVSAHNVLAFAVLLKDHTRFEDRELFTHLTDKDLSHIELHLDEYI